MRKCVFTINIPADDDRRKKYDICTDTIRKYAARTGSDFHCLHVSYNPSQTPHCEKIFCGELLKIYDRILYVDADILIKRDAPDIFSHAPGFIWMLSETENIPVDSEPHHGTIINRFGDMDCPKAENGKFQFYNTGVMLMDKSQSAIFQEWDWKKYFSDIYEQVYLNGLVIRHGKPRSLDSKWNMMMTFHADKKEEAFFIHYTEMHKTGGTMFDDWKRWCA